MAILTVGKFWRIGLIGGIRGPQRSKNLGEKKTFVWYNYERKEYFTVPQHFYLF